MESSANEGLIIATYVFVFIIALSSAVYLFNAIYKYSELAYEYGKNINKSNLLTGIPGDKKIIVKGTDIMSYIYNYTKYDSYSDSSNVDKKYNICIKNSKDSANIDINSTSYSQLLNKLDLSKDYELVYVGKTSGSGDKIEIDLIKQ